ncbi:hypothetical protein AVEN_48879-1 [Araneus ventricosus]|uniref:Uncharacterized protein n=1 Tax=Araneus ventricosus TaxID=182803 RepID=A0A4Y2AGC5_ARAVE|nr:hypothetical protein AVEN_48879-1 [Araneus ventricosus]
MRESMELADEDDDASNPFNENQIISAELISQNRMKKDEGRRCTQFRLFEAKIKKYATILSDNRRLCQNLPEAPPKSVFLQNDKDYTLLHAELEIKMNLEFVLL